MQFTVTAAELTNAATTCQNTNETIQAGIAQMQAYVANLMGSYQGTAAIALQALSDQWGQDAATLNTVLSEIAANLNSNAGNYTTNETTNQTNYNNLLSNLPPARF